MYIFCSHVNLKFVPNTLYTNTTIIYNTNTNVIHYLLKTDCAEIHVHGHLISMF